MEAPKSRLAAVLVAMLVLGLAACATTAESPTGQQPTAPALDQQLIVMAHGPAGTGSYLNGAGMSAVINSHAEGVRIVTQTAAGSVEIPQLVSRGQVQFGNTSSDAVDQLLNENRIDLDNIRFFMIAAETVAQWVVRADSEFHTISDLIRPGAQISIGAPGSGTYAVSLDFIEAFGLTENDIVASHIIGTQAADALRDRRTEGGHFGSAPTPALLELGAVVPLRWLTISDEEAARVSAVNPYYTRGVLSKQWYPGILDEDVPIMRTHLYHVISPEVPDEIVYAMADAVFNHLDALTAIYPGGFVVTPENTLAAYQTAQAVGIEMHPGMEQWLRDNGYLQ